MVKRDRKRVLGVMIKDTKTFEKNRETSEIIEITRNKI